MFTTEGHIVSLDKRLRVSVWQDTFPDESKKAEKLKPNDLRTANSTSNVSMNSAYYSHNGWQTHFAL